jgi:hypothetical protein
MLSRRFTQLLITLLIFLTLSVAYLFMPLHDIDCEAEPFMSSSSPKFQVQATKVVVQPWLGEHQVYAIFTVPNQYKQTPFFILTVKGAGDFCEKPFGNSQYINGISARPDTHLIKDYIRTRLALKLIFQGLYNQIKDKSSWTLTYPM